MTLAALAEAKRLPSEFLRELGLYEVRLKGRPAVAIPYYDEGATEVAVRYRLALEGPERFAWRRGTKVVPYGLWRLDEARKAGWILIVEGESDCWTAWFHGLPALGVPGKSTWRPEWGAYLEALKVFVWQEPDAADFALRIARDLPGVGVIEAPAGVKDLSEAHIAGADVVAMVEALKAGARPVGELEREARDAELARLEAAAAPVLAAADPLELVEAELRRLGYAGDVGPALITYLCLTTRLLDMRHGSMPAHLLLVGPPSAGKSFTLQTVLKLMPEQAYHAIDAGSPRVLIYDNSDLRHRAVIFSETDSLPAGEDNPAASALRNLLQDHRLHYDVVVRDRETGEFAVRQIEKPGPTVLVTTGVRPLGAQLATRIFLLPVPEDAERIRQILARRAELELGSGTEPDGALIAFQSYLQKLAPWEVIVPFARELAEGVARSASAARILRDFERLLSLIKAVTILRHRHRLRDSAGRLVATVDDYATVHRLVGPMYEATLTGATETVRRVVEAVRALRAEGAQKVTYHAVAQRLGLHREQVRRLVRIAVDNEWLVNQEVRKGFPADLTVGEPLPERTGLPRPEELADVTPVTACHSLSQVSQHYRKENTPPSPVEATLKPSEAGGDNGRPPGCPRCGGRKLFLPFRGPGADRWRCATCGTPVNWA